MLNGRLVRASLASPTLPGTPLRRVTVQVHGPEVPLAADTLAWLLGSRRPAAPDALASCTRVVAERDGRAVGAALYQCLDRTLFVRRLGYDPLATHPDEVLLALVSAVELAAQAAGATRLVVAPGGRLLNRLLRRRGYVLCRADCAGCWFERAVA